MILVMRIFGVSVAVCRHLHSLPSSMLTERKPLLSFVIEGAGFGGFVRNCEWVNRYGQKSVRLVHAGMDVSNCFQASHSLTYQFRYQMSSSIYISNQCDSKLP